MSAITFSLFLVECVHVCSSLWQINPAAVDPNVFPFAWRRLLLGLDSWLRYPVRVLSFNYSFDFGE